jgi:RNA polymerase sigma factor (sigma-70 family)
MKKQFSYKLLLAFNQKRSDGFRAVFSWYYKRITYFIFKLVGDKDTAEDLAQDAFILIFLQKKRQFESIEDVGRYLYAIARNVSYSYLDKRRKERDVIVNNSGIDIEQIGGGINIYEQIELEKIEVEVLEIICEAIEGLPETCRYIWKSVVLDERDVNEVAIELSLAPSTIRSQKRHGWATIIEKAKEKAAGKGLLFWFMILKLLYGFSLK